MRPGRPRAASVLLLGILAAAALIAPWPARATMSLSAYEAAASDPAQRSLRKSHLLGLLRLDPTTQLAPLIAFARHPGEGRDPFNHHHAVGGWIPAFARLSPG